jgi:hypothetical protein
MMAVVVLVLPTIPAANAKRPTRFGEWRADVDQVTILTNVEKPAVLISWTSGGPLIADI